MMTSSYSFMINRICSRYLHLCFFPSCSVLSSLRFFWFCFSFPSSFSFSSILLHKQKRAPIYREACSDASEFRAPSPVQKRVLSPAMKVTRLLNGFPSNYDENEKVMKNVFLSLNSHTFATSSCQHFGLSSVEYAFPKPYNPLLPDRYAP